MAEPKIVWRVNRSPRFTLLEIGEYMAADFGPRETMRRNMKYERLAPTLLYNDILEAGARFLVSPFRDQGILESCKSRLEDERDSTDNPYKRDNAIYKIRALEAFSRSLNALPISGLQASLAHRYKALNIEGVKISVQPTILLSRARQKGKTLKGVVVVDFAKDAERKTDDAMAQATLAMTHSAYMLHELVASHINPEEERSSPEMCMIFHTHRQQLVRSPNNYKKQLRNLEVACRELVGMWPNIQAPPNFDKTQARYRD